MSVVSYNEGAMTSAINSVQAAAGSATAIRSGMKTDVEALTNPANWSGTHAATAATELAKIDGYMASIEKGIAEIQNTLNKVKTDYSGLHF